MQLPNVLTERISEWRTASYPHDDFPAIAEILEWLAGTGHDQHRFLRTPQVRALGIHAVYPSRKYLPIKTRRIVGYLVEAFAVPGWKNCAEQGWAHDGLG